MIYFELIGRNDQLSEIGDNGLSLLETVSGLMRYDPLDRFSITLSNARFVDYGGYTIFMYDVSNKEFVSYTLDDVYDILHTKIFKSCPKLNDDVGIKVYTKERTISNDCFIDYSGTIYKMMKSLGVDIIDKMWERVCEKK